MNLFELDIMAADAPDDRVKKPRNLSEAFFTLWENTPIEQKALSEGCVVNTSAENFRKKE